MKTQKPQSMDVIGTGRLMPEGPPKRKISQRELAYGVIRRSILLGHHKHGTRINERVLAEKLGISRVPVREALLCLHGEGLIRKSKRGLEVTKLSPEEILYQVEFRAIMECAAVRLAAERITAPEIERIQEVIAQQEILEHAKDLEAFRESDLVFHQLILKASKNPFMIRLTGSLAMGSVLGEVQHGGVVEGHRRILEAIRRGEADEAEALMYEHITKGPYYADEAKPKDNGDE
jgi:DNA-binding GntR family transcriptional regulator